MKIKINDKYKPLFKGETRYYLLTGGRGSAKSFTVSLFVSLKLKFKNNNALYTRYTLVSAHDSIIPEFKEKIELLNDESSYNINMQDIVERNTGSKILFRGIKTSSGIQTAKLKSLKDINIWVVDEAEELTDETVFDKINLSIRSKKEKNIVILILNPSYRTHWIYKKYFLKTGVTELFNGVKDNVTYIHTDYRDNIEHLPKDLIKEIEELKIKDPQKYNEDILGHWKAQPEGVLFPIEKLKRFKLKDLKKELINTKYTHTDVADQGTDYLSHVQFDIIGDKVFISNVIHTQKGSSITMPLIVDNLQSENIDVAFMESNNQGFLYSKWINEKIKDSGGYKTSIRAYPNTKNKESRIYIQSDWIIDHCYFRTDYDIDSDYAKFMEHITAYNKNGKNEFDDASDSLAGGVKFIRLIERI